MELYINFETTEDSRTYEVYRVFLNVRAIQLQCDLMTYS
jgi:hypothetical protein